MATEVKRRRGTTAEHSLFTGAIAELTVDLTKDTVVVHDGSTQGGFPLLREDFSNAIFTVPDARYLLESNNLSDLNDASTARTNLGVAIGADVQAQNELLEDISGLTIGDGTFLVGDGSGDIVAESGNTARTSLGLGTGDSPTFAGLTVNGNITVTGNVDGRDVSADGADLDELYTTIGLSALTASEVDQLENIGSTTISATQWGYLGNLDQNLRTTDNVTFATVNTGQGANELYAMDQDVQQADSPTFNRVVLTNQADDATKAVRADREVNAGDGLTGGGDLTSDQTLTLGTPGTTEVGGTNAVTSDSHTHALDLSGRSITLSDDSDSVITFDTNTQDLGANRTYTPTIADHGDGQRGVLNTTTQSIYGSKTVINDFKVTTQIESASGFTSGVLGAGTRYDMDDGNGSFFEVDNMRVRNEFRTHIFKKDIVKASNAYLFITDSAEIAETSVIVDTTDVFKVLEDGSNASFEHGDLLWAKNIDDDGVLQSAGVKIEVSVQPQFVWDTSTETWDATVITPDSYTEFASGTVTGGIHNGKTYKEYNIYEVTNGGTLNAGDTIVRVNGGSILNDASSNDSPFIDIYDGVETWADFQSVNKSKVRLGNLSAVPNASGYGLHTQNAFLTGSLVVGDLTKVGQYMEFDGSTLTVKGDVDITGTTIFKSAKDGSTTPTNLNEATFIDGGTIVTNTITATEIDANTITANEIASNTITASQIASNTITSSEIAANTITAFEITAGTITATEIDVADLFAENIEVTGKLTATDGTYEITLGELAGVDVKTGTFTSNGEFYGLYRDLHNYFGIHDGDLFTEYAFRVGDANNFLEFDGTDLTIKTDAFTLETTNLSINSVNELITLGSGTTVNIGKIDDTNFGLSLDANNFWKVSSGEYFFKVGSASNFISFDTSSGTLDIESDTFDLTSGNLSVKSVGTTYPSASSSAAVTTSNQSGFGGGDWTATEISINDKTMVKFYFDYDITTSGELEILLDVSTDNGSTFTNYTDSSTTAVINMSPEYCNGDADSGNGFEISVLSSFNNRVDLLAFNNPSGGRGSRFGRVAVYVYISEVGDADKIKFQVAEINGSLAVCNATNIITQEFQSVTEINPSGVFTRLSDAVILANGEKYLNPELIT